MNNINNLWNKFPQTKPEHSGVFLVTVKLLKRNRYLLDIMFYDKDKNCWYKHLRYDKGYLVKKELITLENEIVIAWQTYQNIMYQPEDE